MNSQWVGCWLSHGETIFWKSNCQTFTVVDVVCLVRCWNAVRDAFVNHLADSKWNRCMSSVLAWV